MAGMFTPVLRRGRVQARASRVQAQTYALLAERTRLQEFCDRYFNALVPREIAYLRPAFPIVFCTVLDYPDMGDDLRWRTGTLSQREVYFAFAIDCYRRFGERWEFVEHGLTTPYIFVDNPASAVAGRERFGFPKQACEFSNEWKDRPAAAPANVEHVLTVSAWDPSTSGHRLEPFMHIVRDESTFGPGFDPVLRPRSLGPLSIENFLWIARTLAGELQARTSPGPLAEAVGQLREIREGWQDGAPCINSYNLRQFADPCARGKASYQDLIRFRMAVTLQNGGIVQERWGAPAAFRLLIHRRDVRPIVDRLGLHVASRERETGPGGRSTIDTLQAIAAVHSQTDVELIRTDRLCWRFQNSGWFDDQNRPITPRRDLVWIPYNDYLGPSAAAFLEPQPDEPVLDLKYLMLPARVAPIREYIKKICPPKCTVEIEPIAVGEHTAIRIVASRSRPPLEREQEELVWLDGQYLSISVPIEYRINGETRRALMMLHDFTDNNFMLQSLRELASNPTDYAMFGAHSGDWFSAMSGIATMLQVDALAIDRSASEALITQSRLIDIFAADSRREETAQTDYAPLVSALWEMVSGIRPLLSFGSIPYPGDPERAIARRLMLTEITDSTVIEQREIDPSRSYFVQFHDSETYPLVRRLGMLPLLPDSPLALRFREGVAGRTHVVPAIRAAQVGLRVRIAFMEILWQELGHFERGTYGGGISTGEQLK